MVSREGNIAWEDRYWQRAFYKEPLEMIAKSHVPRSGRLWFSLPTQASATTFSILPSGKLLYMGMRLHYFRMCLCNVLKELLKCVITVCIVI